MTTPYFQCIFRKVRLLLLFVVMPMAGLFAASESYVQSLTGHLKKGDSLTVIDDKFLNLPLDQWNQLKHLSIDDIITFELRHDTVTKYFTRSFTCTLNVTIKYFTSRDDVNPKEIDSVKLVLQYDTARGKFYPDIAQYRFKNAFKVTVVINSINSPEWKDKLPDCFRLKSQILVERKYPFDPHAKGKLHLGAFVPMDPANLLASSGPNAPTPPPASDGLQAVNGQLPINWNPTDFKGPEEYDIEWTYVDMQSGRGQAIWNSYGGQGPFSIPETIEAQWMWHDATRVTVTTSPYTINLPYLDGYVLVRIRGVSYMTGTNIRQTGDWSYADDAGYSSVAYLGSAYQSNLNWQYTGSFAEEGKRKEVITYYDASQRSRQSVTINNSDLTYKDDGTLSPTAVVQETIYDIMGRSTVNVLPAPTKSAALDYISGFNQNSSGNPYSYSDLGLQSVNNCSISGAPMSTGSGASQYYSPNNSFLDAQNLSKYYFNPYIPDAQTYPFSVTQYMQDNTGRIARQGGVGEDLQTGGTHDTKYYYGKPTLTELQRMFGMEVGDQSHYLKNMVIDPNGQASVSFIDANGKTIATALAGGVPGTMDGLPTSNFSTAGTALNDVLIQPSDFTVDAGALKMSATSTFLAETTLGTYNLVYSVNPLALVTSYAGGASQLCNNCYYSVDVQITDPCGAVLENVQSQPFTMDDFTCYVNPQPVTKTIGFPVTQLGTYTISYSLQLSDQVITDQTNYYVKTNTDLKTLQTFFLAQLNTLDLSGCYSSCTACQALGSSVSDFQANVENLLSTPAFAGITYTTDPSDPIQQWITNTWSTLKQKCAALNCSAPSPCAQKLAQLEQDVLPGGQYALYDPTALENNAATVFLQPQINVMEYYNQDPAISNLTITAADGSTQQVGNLSQADFVRAYLQNPQWASLFVVHHIEYCSYFWCKDASNSTPADDNEVSYTFDATLQQNYAAGSDAVAAGYYNHSDPLALLEKDPWFNGGRGGTYYSNMAADLQNFTAAMSMAPVNNTVNPAVALPTKNIIQWIDWTLYCKPTDANPSEAEMISSWQNCSPNDNCRSVTMEWQQYLNNYLELKDKYYRIAKAAYFAPGIGPAGNVYCQDCFIGTDVLAAAGCVPPDVLTNYQVVHINQGGTCGYYIVYNNGNSPFPSAYSITWALSNFGGTVSTGTVTCNAGDMEVPIFTTQVSAGEDCAISGTYQVTGLSCMQSALAACAATQPTASSGSGGGSTSYTCPAASAFSVQEVNKVGPTPTPAPPADATCDLTTFQVQLNYSGSPLPVAVTVNVVATETGSAPTTYSVTLPAGQTSVLLQNGLTFTNFQGDERVPESQQCATATWSFSVANTAPVCATPPPTYTQTPGPASTCTSNPNYALYSTKTRIFNDYTDAQDYASCAGTATTSGTQTVATATTSMLAEAQVNLSTLQANWLSMLQNVRNSTTAFSGITDATLQTLTADLGQISYTYLQIAAQQNTAMNIVSSLPNPLPSGFTAPNGYYSFEAVFAALIPSNLVQAGFSADLLGNVYPYNKVPYQVDPNVTSLTPDIYSNVSANLTAWQNAWTAAGSPGTFATYLQQQLGDDDLMTASQVSDLQTRIASGCSYPYLSNPTILPVALVAANPSVTCSQMNTLVSSFQAAYPGLPSNASDPTLPASTDQNAILLYQTVFTNYLNRQLGYPLSYADYRGFLEIKSGNSCRMNTAAVLYDKPEQISVADNVFSCAGALMTQAYLQAGQAYTAYITQIRIQFRNVYISKCLSNQASANIQGDQYQYHYTLYYYDQAGNLVKTIPPEGVHLLSDQDLATIQTLPAQNAASCTTYPLNVVTGQQSILSALSTALQVNADAMELWLYNTSGSNNREFRMVTPDNKYMVQAAIANGYVWYELYSLQPESSGAGIDMTLTNEAVATLPPQEVLQNWTHLMFQSQSGLDGGALTIYVDGNKLTNIPLASAPAYPFAWEIDGVTGGGYIVPTTDVTQVQQLRMYQNSALDGDVTLNYQNSCMNPVGNLASAWALWGLFSPQGFCGNNTAASTLVPVPDRGCLTVTSSPPSTYLNNYALQSVTNTFTMEFWANPSPTTQDNFYSGESGDIYAGLTVSHPYAIAPFWGGYAATGMAGVGLSVGTNGVTVFERADQYLPAVLIYQGTIRGWTHIALVYTNKVPSLYINGVLVATGSASPKTYVAPSYNWGGGGYGFFTGSLDEGRIWSVARTPAQIAAAYNEGLSASDNVGLVGYWPMDGTDGNVIHDVSCNGNDDMFYSPQETWLTTGTAPITDNTYVPFASRLIVPNHGLPTYYAYNSLNQVVQQTTPDAGISNYTYDRLGRLSISQNAEQAQPAVADSYNQPGRFSYTKYDCLGRIVEVGEKLGATALSEADARVDANLQAWLATGSNRQATVTVYDAAPSWAPSILTQTNLRKRVAATALLSAGSDPTQSRLSASFYSYDYDGNVSELMQENAALIGDEQQVVTGSTGLKDIQYQYDLISGKVNKVLYQNDKWDQFYYQYTYDADNRVIGAYSSRQNSADLDNWNREALYRYYLHGPLARMELGVKGYKQGVQGVDYAYTLQGWLKGVNGEQVPVDGSSSLGMVADGISGSPFAGTAMDVLGYSLGYFENDYTPVQPSSATAFRISFTPNGDNSGAGTDLYNGNIRYATYAMTPFTLGSSLTGLTGYTYRYDQLNRLTTMAQSFIGQTDGSVGWSTAGYGSNQYGESLSYDGNGNILTNQRGTYARGVLMDNLTYNYSRDANGNLLSNRLGNVNNAVSANAYPGELNNQQAGNYTYDNNGNLIGDTSQNLGMIYWNVYGKMAQIYQGAAPAQGGVYGTGQGLMYGYDPSGNRITKQVTAANGTVTTTHYVRDAQGNVLAVYQYTGSGSTAVTSGSWLEQHLYGSSRLGMLQPHVTLAASQPLAGAQYDATLDATIDASVITPGYRLYELTNHLGNVMVTVNDNPLTPGQGGNTSAGLEAQVVSAQDYYPFGSEMASRTYIASWAGSLNYRYGFNGKENDNEVEGTGNSIDYGMRVYDPRVGRFLSTDPLEKKYPFLTPYQFAGNTPIQAIDLDGKEPKWFNEWRDDYRHFNPNTYASFTANAAKSPAFQYNMSAKNFKTRLGRVFEDAVIRSVGADKNTQVFKPTTFSPKGVIPDIVTDGKVHWVDPVEHEDYVYVFPKSVFHDAKFTNYVLFKQWYNPEQFKTMIDVLANQKGGTVYPDPVSALFGIGGQWNPNLKASDYGQAILNLITPSGTKIDPQLIKYATQKNVQLYQQTTEEEVGNGSRVRVAPDAIPLNTVKMPGFNSPFTAPGQSVEVNYDKK